MLVLSVKEFKYLTNSIFGVSLCGGLDSWVALDVFAVNCPIKAMQQASWGGPPVDGRCSTASKELSLSHLKGKEVITREQTTELTLVLILGGSNTVKHHHPQKPPEQSSSH